MSQTISRLPGFAGIALADILANGVAVIILLIVITVSIKSQQEQEQIEQVDEVSVMLSRDLATSIAMNKLSTSAPARLHDYLRSPQDQNLSHDVMPIIELRRGVVRDYYSGRYWRKSELLLRDNNFDDYLSSLNVQQKQLIRIDLYDVPMFYLVMSIFKDYGINPRHWHFMFDDKKSIGAEIDGLFAGAGQDEGKSTQDGGEQSAAGKGESDSAEDGQDLDGGQEDTETAEAESGSQAEEWDKMFGTRPSLRGAELGSAGGGKNYQLSYQREGQGETSSQRANSQLAFNANGKPLLQGAQIRFAGDGNQSPLTSVPSTKSPEFEHMLSALFVLMRQFQERLDSGLAPLNEGTNLASMLAKVSDKEFLKQLPPADRLAIESLTDHFISYWPAGEPYPLLSRVLDESPRLLSLSVAANTPLQAARLLGDEEQPSPSKLPAQLPIEFSISRYPGLYKGDVVSLEHDAILLMPLPAEETSHAPGWRAVTFINPSFSDFVLGFVYVSEFAPLARAADEDSGEASEAGLTLPFDENMITLNGAALSASIVSQDLNTGESLALFYSLVVICLIGLVLIVRARRRSALKDLFASS